MAGVVRAVGSVVKTIFSGPPKPQAAEQPAPAPVPTDNSARLAAMRDDEMRRRKGSRSNDRTGGAEATTPGAKTLLGK